MKKAPLLVCLSAALLLGAGCASNAPATDMKTPSDSSDTRVMAPEITPEVADAPPTGSALPADFPKDIPIFPAAYITSWDMNEDRAYVMFFSADKTGAETIAWYDKKLAAAGFTQTSMSGDDVSGYAASYENEEARLNITTGLDITGGYKSSMTIYRYPVEVAE